MKRKTRITLWIIILMQIVAITSCKEQQSQSTGATGNTEQGKNLVINNPEPCKEGTLTVYAAGVETFGYAGKIKIINDGRNGEQIKIIIHATEE